MSFTKGITKIYQTGSNKIYNGINEFMQSAEEAGYTISCWNGNIYFLLPNSLDRWVKSDLTIEDFRF
jgi:hypothetical protein